jgi:DNA-binding XRE family transcriptional regulator
MTYAQDVPAVPQLKRLRTAQFLTQQELAHAAGVNLRTIVAAEAGRSLSFKTIRNLAKVLGVKPQDLTKT